MAERIINQNMLDQWSVSDRLPASETSPHHCPSSLNRLQVLSYILDSYTWIVIITIKLAIRAMRY